MFERVVYVLRTGCLRKALPKECFASAIHKRFLEWERAGVFDAIWAVDGAAGASHHRRRADGQAQGEPGFSSTWGRPWISGRVLPAECIRPGGSACLQCVCRP